MEKNNNDQQQKQQYLRDNILNKGYDANEFMDYMRESYGIQDMNLDDYKLEDLKSIVKGFYAKKGENNSANNNSHNIFPQIPKELRSESENEFNNCGSDSLNSASSRYLNENGVENVVRCNQMEKTPLKDKNMEIKTIFPEQMEGGLFSGSYISYGVNIPSLNINVRKRYSDFEWLYKKLTEYFVNCVVPPLCKKNFFKRFDKELISKRSRNLEKFLNGIAIHPILKNSFIFYYFMQQDNEEIKQKKEFYEQPFNPKKINDLNNVDGLIKVNLSYGNEIYFQNIVDDLKMNQRIMHKIIQSYKYLFELFTQINKIMTEIGLLWQKFEQKSKKYYEPSNAYKSYSIMKGLMKDWGEMNKKQITQIKYNIVENFRYIKNEYANFQQLEERVLEKKEKFFKTFDEFDNQYIHDQKKSLSIKEKIEKFNEIDFNQISPLLSQTIREAKNFYCGYLNCYISEYERLREINGKKIKDCIVNFINSFTKDYGEFFEIIKKRLLVYNNNELDDNSLLRDNNSVISTQ